MRKLYVIDNGFTLVGKPLTSPAEGWVAFDHACVVRKYTGGKGLGGVASGLDATVVFDPIPETVEVPVDKVIWVTTMSNPEWDEDTLRKFAQMGK